MLDDIPDWLGLEEAPWTLPVHPVTDRLLAEHPGVRLTDTHDVFEALVNVVLQQLVTWNEAAASWRRLCETLGETAPGPRPMRLSPTPRAIRAGGAARLQSCGIGSKRARTLIRVADRASAMRRAAAMDTESASRHLQLLPGIGPWTASAVLGMRMARPEPIPLGDFHFPNTVAWALAGEPRGTEERMLELLAPFEGKQFLVMRLLFAARIQAPRRGPRRGFQRHRR